ncbi:MAG: hypothetical protein R2712_01695 [Vicinamibacterales bacterium]
MHTLDAGGGRHADDDVGANGGVPASVGWTSLTVTRSGISLMSTGSLDSAAASGAER